MRASSMIHIGFTGTQQGMTQRQGETVWALVQHKQFYAHHGDCIGADAEFHKIVKCAAWCYGVVVHPPTNHAKRAFVELDPVRDILRTERPYLQRNRKIVDESVWLIATPKEEVAQLRSGTWSTVRYARSKLPLPTADAPIGDRRVIIVFPNGGFTEEIWRS